MGKDGEVLNQEFSQEQQQRREADRRLTAIEQTLASMASALQQLVRTDERTLTLLENYRTITADMKGHRERIERLELADARTESGFVGPLKTIVGIVAGAVIAGLVGGWFR